MAQEAGCSVQTYFSSAHKKGRLMKYLPWPTLHMQCQVLLWVQGRMWRGRRPRER